MIQKMHIHIYSTHSGFQPVKHTMKPALLSPQNPQESYFLALFSLKRFIWWWSKHYRYFHRQVCVAISLPVYFLIDLWLWFSTFVWEKWFRAVGGRRETWLDVHANERGMPTCVRPSWPHLSPPSVSLSLSLSLCLCTSHLQHWPICAVADTWMQKNKLITQQCAGKHNQTQKGKPDSVCFLC